MVKQIWINLPVKDLARSKAFFTKIGFALNPKHGNTDHSACFLVGEKAVVLMLFVEPTFTKIVRHDVADAQHSTEVLFSIDAESRAEVNELSKKAKEAGGGVFAEPGESQGWMYGCGFSDPDGHRWNVLHMDMSKMPGA